MTDAVIVSTARTPIGKAHRGAFNMTTGPTLGAHVISHAVQRAGVDPAEVEEVILGVGRPEGTTGGNVARQSAIKAGLSVGSTGSVISRACGSGLNAIAHAAHRVIVDRVPVVVAGGMESISLTVNDKSNTYMARDPWVLEHKPSLYDTMIQTAETVAKRYGISREIQDFYGARSQQRVAAALAAGRFDAEVVPLASRKAITNKDTGETLMQDVMLTHDEGIRGDTTFEG
ncbi:MAG: acetyl-CoA C-acyltransferase, partial [Burkholderiaceae bacterium]